MAVTLHSSVDGFFHEVLTVALEHEGLQVSESTEYYLVGLLGDFTTTRVTDEALALKLARADDDAGERVRALKEVGDTTLYMTGFFAESIERQVVQADYYIDLGGAAYNELANRLNSSSVSQVYRELAAKFPRFVDALARVRDQVRMGNADIVRLHQQWLASRSEWVEKRLRDLGVVIAAGTDKYPQ